MRRAPSIALVSIALLLITTLPVTAADTDRDGLRDGWEKRHGLDHTKRDSDGDGVVDSAEDLDGDKLGNLGEQRWGTNPRKRDSDGDGRHDGREDKNRNGISNAREQDRRPVPPRLIPTLSQAKSDAPKTRASCMANVRSWELRRCWFGPKDSRTRVAFMGDSHAVMWLPGAIKAANTQGWRLVTLLKGGCSPILGTRNRREYKVDRGRSCRLWRKAAYAWLAKKKVDLLVITFADSYRLVDARGNVLRGGDRIKAWRSGAKKTIEAAPDPSRVVLMGDVPHNRGNPITCLARSPRNMSKCVNPKEPYRSRKIERALRQAAAKKGAQFHTLYNKICTYDPCPLVQGNVLLWRDRHHLTATFTRKLAPSLRGLFKAGLAGVSGR